MYIAPLSSTGQHVVVKRTKITGPNDMKRFDKELELLSACAHESVVAPLGVLRAPPTYALVLPVFAGGALFSALHASGKTLTDAAKVAISCDIAAAIAHLHSHGILHRDVKSDNVLLDGHGRAVLTDFNAAEWSARVTSDIVMQARPTGGFFKQFVVGTLPCAWARSSHRRGPCLCVASRRYGPSNTVPCASHRLRAAPCWQTWRPSCCARCVAPPTRRRAMCTRSESPSMRRSRRSCRTRMR